MAKAKALAMLKPILRPVKLPGPCTSVGVHENVPLTGVVPGVLENVAPVGRPLAVIVKVLAGRSESVQLTVKVSNTSSLTV